MKLPEKEWKCRYADGGQQKDTSNCGIYAVEWIQFRVRTAVERRRLKEADNRFKYLEEKRRETKTKPLESCELESRTLCYANASLATIRKLRAEK